MTIRIGTSGREPDRIFVGDSRILRVYRGDSRLWGPAPLPAPTGLTVGPRTIPPGAPNISAYTLSWNQVAGADGYMLGSRLQRPDQAGGAWLEDNWDLPSQRLFLRLNGVANTSYQAMLADLITRAQYQVRAYRAVLTPGSTITFFDVSPWTYGPIFDPGP